MVERRSFSLPLRCDYLFREPEQAGEDAMWIVLLHGHAMTPEQMLELMLPLVGKQHYVASLRGPYQIWLNQNEAGRSKVGFHWATNFEPEYSRRLHHDMILRVIGDLGIPAERTVLVGYSQAVSLNYRFVCTHTEAVRGVIGICGGVPGDWETAVYRRTKAAALHIAAREDPYYPPQVSEHFPERLRRYIPEVRFHMVEGGHRIPTAAGPILREWLGRVAATRTGEPPPARSA